MKHGMWQFSRCGAQVTVIAEGEIMHSLVPSVQPYIQTREFDATNPSGWSIIARYPALMPTGEYERRTISSSGEPEAEALIFKETKSIYLVEQDNVWLVVRVRRMLRNLLRLQLAAQGAVFLHGGMVKFAENAGVAYVGASKAGKTSSVLAALTQKAAFVTNDDLSILLEESPLALGWPRSICVRRDTLGVLGSLPGGPWEALPLTHPTPNPLDLEFVCFSPSEIADLFQCQVACDATLTHLVFPAFFPRSSTSAPSVQKLQPQEALSLLYTHLEPPLDDYHRWLNEYVSVPLQREASLLKLVEQIHCYRLHQPFSGIVAASTLIKNIGEQQLPRL